MDRRELSIVVVVLVLLSSFLAGCGAVQLAATPTPIPTPTPTPTETPLPSLPRPTADVCIETGGSHSVQEVQRTQLLRQLKIIIEPWEYSDRMYPEEVTVEALGEMPEFVFGLGGECDYTVDLSDLEVWPREADYTSEFNPWGSTRWTGCEVEGTISIELPTGETRSVDVPYSMDETDEEISVDRAPQEAWEAPCGYLWLKPLLHLMADVWGDDFLIERAQVLEPLLGGYWPPDELDPKWPVPAQDTSESFLDLLEQVIAEREAGEGSREQPTEPSTDRAALASRYREPHPWVTPSANRGAGWLLDRSN